MTSEEMTVIFQQRLSRLNITCDAQTPKRLAAYHTMLEEWNQRINLTGDASLDVCMDRNYVDSLVPLGLDGFLPRNAKVIDVGSGAGFPGLPLAIARPDVEVLLLDSLQKRLKFLDAVIEELGLTNVRTAHARAEDAGHMPQYREQFDLALARAVASAPVLLELLMPFVRIGGKVACYKGPAAEEELQAGTRAAKLLGGSPLQVLPVTIPTQPEWQHCILQSQKKRETGLLYPRKAGMPAKMPLGM